MAIRSPGGRPVSPIRRDLHPMSYSKAPGRIAFGSVPISLPDTHSHYSKSGQLALEVSPLFESVWLSPREDLEIILCWITTKRRFAN
jgi:hypothetical protein